MPLTPKYHQKNVSIKPKIYNKYWQFALCLRPYCAPTDPQSDRASRLYSGIFDA